MVSVFSLNSYKKTGKFYRIHFFHTIFSRYNSLSYISEYHLNPSTQRNLENDHAIPITVFPPNSALEIPSIMEDNPSYFSMECLIQV